MTALNVKYRDFRYIIPFIVQFGVYVSPVGFSSAIVPQKWRLWYEPQSGGRSHRRLPLVPVGGARWTFANFSSASGVTIIFLWLGIAYFRRTERSFADI